MSDLDTALYHVDDDDLSDRAKAELKDLRKRIASLEGLLAAAHSWRLVCQEDDLGRRAIVSGGEVLEI